MLARVPGGFAVMGDVQWLPCYCTLLTNDLDVTRLIELPSPTAHAIPGKIWTAWPRPSNRAGRPLLCHAQSAVVVAALCRSQSWNILEL